MDPEKAFFFMKRVRTNLLEKLNNEDVNIKVIKQLNQLDVFDDDKINPTPRSNNNKECRRIDDLSNFIENL